MRCRDDKQRPALNVQVSIGQDRNIWNAATAHSLIGLFCIRPPAGEEEHKRWADFYGWLGVGWAPKVLPILLEPDELKTRRGWQWKDGRFVTEGLPEPPGWRDCCAWAWARRYQRAATSTERHGSNRTGSWMEVKNSLNTRERSRQSVRPGLTTRAMWKALVRGRAFDIGDAYHLFELSRSNAVD